MQYFSAGTVAQSAADSALNPFVSTGHVNFRQVLNAALAGKLTTGAMNQTDIPESRADVVKLVFKQGLSQADATDIIATGGRARFVAGDVTRSNNWAALVAAAQDFGSRLDCVVNNAGWTPHTRPMLEVSGAGFDKICAVTMKNIYWSALHGMPAMKQT